jgi:predicted transcriptional regulator
MIAKELLPTYEKTLDMRSFLERIEEMFRMSKIPAAIEMMKINKLG